MRVSWNGKQFLQVSSSLAVVYHRQRVSLKEFPLPGPLAFLSCPGGLVLLRRSNEEGEGIDFPLDDNNDYSSSPFPVYCSDCDI